MTEVKTKVKSRTVRIVGMTSLIIVSGMLMSVFLTLMYIK